MNTSFFIARKYFFSKKKRGFINVIAIISMLGIGVATASLIVVLSALNGMEGLLRSLYGTFDPDLKISATVGKSFVLDSLTLADIRKTEGVAYVSEIIEDNALLKYKDRQMIVRVKGVSDNFTYQTELDSMIVQGKFILNADSIDYAVVGRGIQFRMQIVIADQLFPLQFIYPKNKKNISIDPSNSFNQQLIMPSAVFAIEKQYDDNYVFVPLSFAQTLLNYQNKRTSLEIKTKTKLDKPMVKQRLKALLGKDFLVHDSDEQHESLLKAVKIEKLFVYLTFSIIVGIASFNIFLCLTMLAIEKRKDVAILKSLGANSETIMAIFVSNGAIIGVTGAISGLFLGLGLCWLQTKYGFVSMGMQTSVVDAYPILVKATDVLLTCVTIIVITLLSCIGPSAKASKILIRENL